MPTSSVFFSRFDNQVLLKREDLQPIFSFKIRGAYHKLLQLGESQWAGGVVAASAGNHAQGVSMASRHLGIIATIVMPLTTPSIKVESVKRFGAKVILTGDTYDEASEYAVDYAEKNGCQYIHPYDDADVIAGQGTVAMEIFRQTHEPIHSIFIPVGGGGLCAGKSVYIKYLRPEVKVIAVEPKLAMEKNRRSRLSEVNIFADGVAVAQIGKEPFKLIRDRVDEVITVSTDEICAAIKDLFDDTRSIAEPAGACALAGLKKYMLAHKSLKSKTLVAVHSGANTNFHRLRYISERTEIGEKRELVLAVSIPEEPGSYNKFCSVLGKRSITEFNYRYSQAEGQNLPEQAHIFVGLQVSPESNDGVELIKNLEGKGYRVVDMTENDMAKNHIRHMVGGRVLGGISDEVVYRFEFPERPGALLQFLKKLAGRWNISLFHYRNHGAAFGRVLVGMQIPIVERKIVECALLELGYPFREETDNQAYHLFLK